MCPACLAAAATTWILAGSATGAGGFGALALVRFAKKARLEEDFHLRMQPDDEGEET
jgi:hypothetical protein